MATAIPKHDLHDLIKIDINAPIPQTPLEQALKSDPFVPIPGIINLRDLGALPSSPIRRGLLYRSGGLHNLPPDSLAALKEQLGIKFILDLRTPRETARAPDPIIEGVTNVHFEDLKAPTPVVLSDFLEEGGVKGYAAMYDQVLEIHGLSIRKVLEWVRDGEGPVLFHCSAGKDRTGVISAILLSLAGTPKEAIAFDYALTRVGVEPARELLLQMLKLWNADWTPETPGMAEFSAVKPEYMLGTLDMVESKYGGAEGYVKGLGFGEEDLVRIRKGLMGV